MEQLPFSIPNLPTFLIIFGLIALVFALTREVSCWYWKINHVITLLEDIKRNTTTEKKE